MISLPLDVVLICTGSVIRALPSRGAQTRNEVGGYIDRTHLALLPACAHRGHRPRPDQRVAADDRERILNRPPGRGGDLHDHVELFLEAQRTLVVERGGHAGPAACYLGGADAEPGSAPQRVLRFFHEAEVPAEVRDAGEVCLAELHAAPVPEP